MLASVFSAGDYCSPLRNVNKIISVLFVFLSVSAATWINDTRSSVLRINSNDSECIFWPNGMASFAKTRTARIIAEQNRENGRSCSAVSFSPIDNKHASDHFRVFTTLAYRLDPPSSTSSQTKISAPTNCFCSIFLPEK